MLLTSRSMQLRRRFFRGAGGGSAGRCRASTPRPSSSSPAAAILGDNDRAIPIPLAIRHVQSSPLRAYDWSKGAGVGVGVVGNGEQPPSRPFRRFAASEDADATDQLVSVVGRALAGDPVTLAYALPGKEQRYCEAALRAGLLTDAVGRDRRLWLSECGRAAAVAYLATTGGGGGGGAQAASTALLPRPPPLPLFAGAQRAALTAQALTSLKPGEPARACARAATALARVRAAYCAAVERRSAAGGSGGGDQGDQEDGMIAATTTVVAYVSVLAVDPPAQGRGLGTRLLRDVLRELLLSSGPHVASNSRPALHAYVEASSERSAALYARLGFRVIASVDADGTVSTRTGGGALDGGEAEEEGDGDDEGGEYHQPLLPRAPTLVMAAELKEKGRFSEWLLEGDR